MNDTLPAHSWWTATHNWLIEKANAHFHAWAESKEGKRWRKNRNYPGRGDVCVLQLEQTENADGNPPSKAEQNAFKTKQARLWNATYSFLLEKRTIENVTEKDLDGLGFDWVPQ